MMPRYMTHACLQVHRPGPQCFPFTVASSPSAGRILIATKDIPALSLILKDQALASGPKLRSLLVCIECSAQVSPDKMVTCSTCHLPFCGLRCRKTRRLHGAECKVVARAEGGVRKEELTNPESGVLGAVTVLRLLQHRQSWFLANLVDHVDDIKKTEDWPAFLAVVTFIRERCGAREFSEEEILHALGVLSSNACNMSEFRARALFPTYSLMNHSCAANAR